VDSETAGGNKDDGRTAEAGKLAEKKPDVIQEAREEYGSILGYAARTIILRLVFAKAVPPILEVWGYSALGAKVLKREKKKVVSVSPVNF